MKNLQIIYDFLSHKTGEVFIPLLENVLLYCIFSKGTDTPIIIDQVKLLSLLNNYKQIKKDNVVGTMVPFEILKYYQDETTN